MGEVLDLSAQYLPFGSEPRERTAGLIAADDRAEGVLCGDVLFITRDGNTCNLDANGVCGAVDTRWTREKDRCDDHSVGVKI